MPVIKICYGWGDSNRKCLYRLNDIMSYSKKQNKNKSLLMAGYFEIEKTDTH